MTLSDKLYRLRKKQGLSQEQLAERLNVSRQAISKWESGQSVPESDKLLAISRCFGVSLDYLMKEDATEELPSANDETFAPQKEQREKNIGGLVICLCGIAGLLLWGVITLFAPSVSDQLGTASMVQIDGNGILLAICSAAAVFGAVLLLKNNTKK